MNERRTLSMLQRVPVILAVTAASYGLQVPQQGLQRGQQALGGKVSQQAQAANKDTLKKAA